MSSAQKEFLFVGDSETLREVTELTRSAALVALDTEFVRERTYFPELCVLQIASDDFVAAIDCLADIELAALFDALVTPGKTWLLHSARQDLEVLLVQTGRRPDRLIDTQIASALLGSSLQIGLQALLAETLNLTIGKEHTRTDWSRRPLAEEAIRYAIDDVRYLLPTWRELEQRLDDTGRMPWFIEDCARQLQLPIQPDPQSILERTKGAGSLAGGQRSAALALVAWREREAIRRNKPRRWILADDVLIRIAARCPDSVESLQQVRDLPRRLATRSGDEIVASIREAGPAPPFDAPGAADKTIVSALKAQVRARADELGIQPELLATRRDIALAAVGKAPEILRLGWRSQILGDALEQIG